jgi:hypothetical protein
LKTLRKEDKVSQVMAIGSRPVFGVPLGKCKMIFRYAGQRSFIELEGSVFDATTLFCNVELQAEFKELILEEIAFLEESRKPAVDRTETSTDKPQSTDIQPAEKSPIDEAKEQFKNYDFTEVCNVLILEESFTRQRHIILQVGRLGSLTEYASYCDRSQWNLMRGLKVEFIVDGLGISFPHRQRLIDLGEVYIHIFIPTDHRKNSSVVLEALNKAKPLAQIIPYIPQALDIKEMLRAKDAIIGSKDDSLRIMKTELTEKSTELDAVLIAIAGHGTKSPPATLTPKRLDFWDAVIAGVPAFICAAIGEALGPGGWLGGLVVGWLIGFGMIFRRK